MDSTNLFQATATELAQLLDSGECTSLEIAQAFIERTNLVDDQVHAFFTWMRNICSNKQKPRIAEERRARPEPFRWNTNWPKGRNLRRRSAPHSCK